MKLLITGAGGFVGRQLSRAFVEQGHTVYAVDLVDLESESDRLKCLRCDLTDPRDVEQLPLAEVDIIYHLAAAGVKAHARDWSLCNRVNVIGTGNLIGALSDLVVKGLNPPHLIYTYSFYENHLREFHGNSYVVTKAAASSMISAWGKLYSGGVSMVCVYQVFGPGDDAKNVLSYAVKEFQAGRVARFSSGEGLRDWIYIDDFIAGLVRVSDVAQIKRGVQELDLGSGNLVSIREMIKSIGTRCGVGHEAMVFDSSLDRGDSSIVDRAVNLPEGWRPSFSTDAALTRMLEVCDE